MTSRDPAFTAWGVHRLDRVKAPYMARLGRRISGVLCPLKQSSTKGDCIVIPLEYAAQWRVDAEPLRLFAQRWLRR